MNAVTKMVDVRNIAITHKAHSIVHATKVTK